MRDVLRGGDQEHYFRVLARLELLLPVSADSAGRRSPGWGTWSSDGRTHVLAFTSIHAMRACLAEHAGNYRLAQFRELAEQWPNPEWWLAINPGLPIEGYLPAWFVAQISRGDVRLPGRAMGSRARMEHANTLRARAVAQVPRRMPPAPPVPAGGGRVPPGRRPPGAGIVLSGEIVESTPVDEPVSPAAPTPVQPAARTVLPGIPGATIGGRTVRQPGVVPPGRERSAEPFPASPAPAPGAVPASPAPAAASATAMPAAPTSPPARPGRGDSNGRGDGVIPGRPGRSSGPSGRIVPPRTTGTVTGSGPVNGPLVTIGWRPATARSRVTGSVRASGPATTTGCRPPTARCRVTGSARANARVTMSRPF